MMLTITRIARDITITFKIYIQSMRLPYVYLILSTDEVMTKNYTKLI